MKTKTRLILPLLILMPLTACQSEQPAATTAPASNQSATATTTSPAASTVAVTKEVIDSHAKDLQANIAQNKAAVTKAAEQLTESLTDSAKAAEKAATDKAAEAAKVAAATKAAEAAKAAATIKAASLTATTPQIGATGDATKGKSLANKCKGCHKFTAKKKVGPGLQGVVGRKAGAMPGMKYSAALAASDWVWNEKNLAIWVCDSKKAVKILSGNASAKTKMGAQRICDATKQADLIAFLKTL